MNDAAQPSPGFRPELVQLHAAVIYVNRRPFMRFASTPQAGIFLTRLGFRGEEKAGVYTFWKPADLIRRRSSVPFSAVCLT